MEQSLRSMQYPLIVTDRPVQVRHGRKSYAQLWLFATINGLYKPVCAYDRNCLSHRNLHAGLSLCL